MRPSIILRHAPRGLATSLPFCDYLNHRPTLFARYEAVSHCMTDTESAEVLQYWHHPLCHCHHTPDNATEILPARVLASGPSQRHGNHKREVSCQKETCQDEAFAYPPPSVLGTSRAFALTPPPPSGSVADDFLRRLFRVMMIRAIFVN